MNFIVLAFSDTASSQNIEREPAAEEGHTKVEVAQKQQMEMREEEVKQGDKLEQENLAPHIYLDH